MKARTRTISIEIMFADLSPKKQKEVLKAFNIDDPSEMNWDTFPITSIESEIE